MRTFILIPLFALSACYESTATAPASAQPPAFAIQAAPLIGGNPNTWVPLCAVVRVETNAPSRISLRVTDIGNQADTWVVADAGGFSLLHKNVPVLGLKPSHRYSVEVTARNELAENITFPNLLFFTAPALPAKFPPITLVSSDPVRMAPGVTVFNAATNNRNDKLIAVDNQGEVVWYLDDSLLPRFAPPFDFVKPTFLATKLPNDNFILIVDKHGIVEVTKTGDVISAFWAANIGEVPSNGGAFSYIPISTDSFHHDVTPLPESTGSAFTALGSELRVYNNYPTSVTDPTQTQLISNVVGDTIVEWKLDGTKQREIRLFDLLDPRRICYDGLAQFWTSHYGRSSTADWSHANGLAYDSQSDSYLVSLRHQDAIIKIARSTGQLEWILGAPGRWEGPWLSQRLIPENGVAWQYHQHAPIIEPNGRILCFDNGNERSIPPVPGAPLDLRYSRAVEFEVSDLTRVVRQTWSYTATAGSEAINSYFVGNATRLTNNNVLICDGGKGNPATPTFYSGRIVEVTNNTPASVVFDVKVRDQSPTNPSAWFLYRAFRMTGFGR